MRLARLEHLHENRSRRRLSCSLRRIAAVSARAGSRQTVLDGTME